MIGRRSLLAALASGAMLSLAGRADAAEEGHALHPWTWINWLSTVKIAGHPVIASQAGLALAWSLLVLVGLALSSILATRRLSLRPRGVQIALEMVVGGFKGLLVTIIGPRGGEFVPFIGTLFVYIASMNLVGLVPGAMAPTSNLSITAGLAVIVFFVVQSYGIREHGFGYLAHFTAGVPKGLVYVPLGALVFLVHVVGEFFRPVTLALRLFGNILAGETLILVLVGLSAGLLVRLIVPIPLQLPNMAMEVLIAVVQATVFSLLTAVYLSGVVGQGEAEA